MTEDTTQPTDYLAAARFQADSPWYDDSPTLSLWQQQNATAYALIALVEELHAQHKPQVGEEGLLSETLGQPGRCKDCAHSYNQRHENLWSCTNRMCVVDTTEPDFGCILWVAEDATRH